MAGVDAAPTLVDAGPIPAGAGALLAVRPGFGFWCASAWIATLVTLAALAAWLPLPDPTDMDMLDANARPSGAHWLGTDTFGRDIVSRLVYGARVSLTVGLIAPLIGAVLGGALGIVSGYFRGWLDTCVVGGIDVVLAFPPLVLALAVSAFMGQSVVNLTLILGFLFIPAFTRVARATTLQFVEREFVIAARALGATHTRIVMREILPNVLLPLASLFLAYVAIAVVVEGALSFLGLGVAPPRPRWGSMIAEGRENLDEAAWLAFSPAIAMFVTVLAFNYVGDSIRTLSDPRRTLQH